MNLDKFLKKVNGWRVMGQPIGKGLAYGAAFGIVTGLAGLVNRLFKAGEPRIPMLIAAIILKTKAVESRIGKEASELFASAAWISIVAWTVNLAGLFEMPFVSLLGARPAAPPVIAAAAPSLLAQFGRGAAAGFVTGIPIVGASLAQYLGLLPGPPANEGDLGAAYGYEIDTVGLGEAPLLLTSAEEKIASINV